MRILFIGDIFGRPGRHIVKERLPELVKKYAIDLVIANGENSAAGFGITPPLAEELFELGIEVLTSGNHIWDKREILDYFRTSNGGPHSPARRAISSNARPPAPRSTPIMWDLIRYQPNSGIHFSSRLRIYSG